MIKNKKMFSLLIALFMVISIASPMLAEATTPQVEKGSLTIHKLYFPNQMGATIPGNGEQQSAPAGSLPLKGAQFTIWKVADDAEMPINKTGLTAIGPMETNAAGLAAFSNLPYGRYYVEETKLPKGVTQGSAPFIIDVPGTSTDGNRLIDDMHVYPKNVLTLAKAQMSKVDDHDKGLAGAEFDLYKVGNPDVKINTIPLVTEPDGKTPIVLDLEVGDYYFIETKAPTGYLKDTTKQEFKVLAGSDHHNKLFVLRLINSEKPKQPEKTVDKSDSGIGDKVTWTIKTQLPSNIKTYTEYKITDVLDPALNYDNNVIVKLDGTQLALNTDYTVSAPTVGSNGTLVINFVPAKLEKGNLVITFDTIINEKAVAGTDIENKAILDYNNGFEVGKETTPPAHVKVGGHQFKKVDKKLNKVLEGAQFIIKRNSDGKYLVKDTLGMITWGSEGQATKFVSDHNGLINVNGVAFGDYQLIETKAPDGYSKLINPVPFTVGANTHTTILEVVNKTKPGMPQTGGMGTLAFTAIGLAFMGIAAKTYKKEEE